MSQSMEQQPSTIKASYEYVIDYPIGTPAPVVTTTTAPISTVYAYEQPQIPAATIQQTPVQQTVTNTFPVESRILTATLPIETLETETATVFGQTGILLNREEINTWRGPIPLSQYQLNEDLNPEIIHKKTDQAVHYTQEVAIRYLRPPTPPQHGEIIIKEENPISMPPAPPLVIRQQPPRPETPPPMIIREAPPRPPMQITPKLVTISGKRIPPPPRKVIIERLPPIPAPPQSIIIERWLGYPQFKRNVIFQKATEKPLIYPKPKNTIIQWEAPMVEVRKEIKDLGVVRANPVEFVERYGSTLKHLNEFPQFVKDIRPPPGLVLATEWLPTLPSLEGDIEALALIDVEREGLSEYRYVADQYKQSAIKYLYSDREAPANLRELYTRFKSEILTGIRKNEAGYITNDEVRRVLNIFNEKLGRTLCMDQTNRFINIMDRNHSGLINYDEFVRALESTIS